jgi:LmbE family N-acetylglucosaminyl deacetylase
MPARPFEQPALALSFGVNPMCVLYRSRWARVTEVRARVLSILASTIPLLTACNDLLPTEDDPSVRPLAFTAPTPAVEAYVVAHQDDWQLFIGNHTVASMQAAATQKVVIIFTTAGDAGSATSFPAYWQAREAAATASVDQVLGAGAWTCAVVTVNGHNIRRCSKGKVVQIFMRLPDGNGEGTGFGFGSLSILRDSGTPLSAVDGTTTYTSWADLAATLQALITAEGGTLSAPNLAVRTSEWNRTHNGGDHADHLATGDLVRAASVGRLWVLFWYMGYQNLFREPNVFGSEYDQKWAAFLAYDQSFFQSMGETLIGNSHAEEWIRRTIYRTETSTGVLPVLGSTEAFIIGHQDDWMLFMGPGMANSILNGARVVFIYLTAGDAGAPANNPNFWLAREQGTKEAINSIQSNPWMCANDLTNGHTIWRCTAGNVIKYFLRLPDGGGNGQGYFDRGSLIKLRDSDTPLTALNGSSTYNSWIDLSNTVLQIIVNESGNQSSPYVAVHSSDFDRRENGGDHPDHLAAADLTRSISQARTWQIFRYIGYQSKFLAQNLAEEGDHVLKDRIFMAYDNYMAASQGERLSDEADIQAWLRRTYFRDHPSAALSPLPPAAPGGLVARAVNGVRIDLTWLDNSASEDGFIIDRAPDVGGAPGAWSELKQVGFNVTSFSNTGLPNATTFWYRVRAFNLFGESTNAAQASATTMFPPAAPSGLSGVAVSSEMIDLSWTDNSSNEQQFRIDRAPDVAGAPGAWTQLATPNAGVTSFRARNMTSATTYWFRIRSQNPAGNSDFTTPVAFITLTFAAPSALNATGFLVGTQRNVDLTWTPGSELTVDVWRNGTKILSGRPNNGGPVNHRPGGGAGGVTNTYQVCVAGKPLATENCSNAVTVTF